MASSVGTSAPPARAQVTLEVTVVFAVDRSGATRGPLRSHLEQTLEPRRYEVVVALGGDRADLARARADVQRLRRRYPDHAVRVVEAAGAGARRARELAVHAARGRHLLLASGSARADRGMLAALLERAAPGVVVAAPVVASTGTRPERPLPAVRPAARSVVEADEVDPLLTSVAGVLVPRSLWEAAGTSAGEPDVVLWLRLLARTGFRVGLAPAAPGTALRPQRDVEHDEASLVARVSVLVETLRGLDDVVRSLPDEPDPVVTAVAAASTAAAWRGLNDVLRVRPDLHPLVVRRLRENDLLALPTAGLNRGLAHDLAIVYCFTPFNDTSATVAARRLLARGTVVDVVCQDVRAHRTVDDTTRAVSAPVVDEVVQVAGRATALDWPLLADFCRGGEAAIAALERTKGRYRSVYSRSMWPGSHLLAALYKLEHPEVPWTAEMSDPQLLDVRGEERLATIGDDEVTDRLRAGFERAGVAVPDSDRVMLWVESLAYAFADEVQFTNENQREYMLGYHPDRRLAERARERSSVSHHPVLPEAYYRVADPVDPTSPDRVDIAYFGAFYVTRGLTEVVDALGALPEAERARVRLHVFTARPDALREEIASAGLDDVVVAGPYVPYLEFLALTTRFDVLLVNDARTVGTHPLNPYLPSKWSDYLGSGTPTWTVVEEGSVLSRQPSAYSSALGDVDDAVRVLREIVASREGQT